MPDRSPQHSTTDNCRIDEDRYRVLIEDVADGFYETDLKGNFKFFNDALCRIFGRTREEIQNHNFREFMDEENARIAFESFNSLFRVEQGAAEIIWEISRRHGRGKRSLEISAKLIFDPNGQKIGFRGIARDVTDKIRAQQEVLASKQLAQKQYRASRRAEQRYRAFLNFLPDPVFVFDLDSTVSYLNPAFEKVFGWTLEELEGKRIPFVPEAFKEQTRQGVKRLFEEKVIHGFETKRLTKDGRILDIIIDGAIFYDENGRPAGQVITLRDVTRQKRAERTHRTLFRIAEALHHYRDLDGLLAFITKETQDLLSCGGALVILLDEKAREFFFRAAAYDDSEVERRYKEVRYPADKGVTGQVYRTGKPLIVLDYYSSPYFVRQVDEQTGFVTRDMLQVPIWIESRMIGALCAVNKKEGHFESADVDLLSTVAGMVALPIENARINFELQQSYDEVKTLNRAKDRVIHHLSHELKTPVSVLSASLSLLSKKLSNRSDAGFQRIIDRSQRNLNRLLDMQYEIEDIIKERDYFSHRILSSLVDVCADELEVLLSEACGEEVSVQSIRKRIDALFGPKHVASESIPLDGFVADMIPVLEEKFSHRRCRIITRLDKTDAVRIPPEVLSKVVEGLIRNAVENTPDGGCIEIAVQTRPEGPRLLVIDHGIGIPQENQAMLFENYFPGTDTLLYATRKPFDFGAGGRGFDLLRMKIFSERYGFKISMASKRCRHIPSDTDVCPGAVELCRYCKNASDCKNSGGTEVKVQFFTNPDSAPKETTPE